MTRSILIKHSLAALNPANRLVRVTDSATATAFVYNYNGLGDRVALAAGGVTTTYTLDPPASSGQALAGGLTQVLGDGTFTYTYGLGRG